MLHDGLYEQVISKELDSELAFTDKLSQTAPIDSPKRSTKSRAITRSHGQAKQHPSCK